MHKKKAPPVPPGRGAASARQLGLLVDFSPDGMMIPEDSDHDADLEAEFMALVGAQLPQELKSKAPLPMETIEKMASLCMKDLDEGEGEEDDDDVEDDDELLAELNEVLGEREKPQDSQSLPLAKSPSLPQPKVSPSSAGMETTLAERLAMYQTAITNAKQAGDSSKVRRYERGVKTLENMLVSVKKGRSINEEDIPPPVAVGKSLMPTPEAPPMQSATPTPPPQHQLPTVPPKTLPVPPSHGSGVTEKPVPIASPLSSGVGSPGSLVLLQERQQEYKRAALRSKQEGNLEAASKYFRVAKSFDAVLEAMARGEAVDLSRLPPPPDQMSRTLPSPGLQPHASTPGTGTVSPSMPEMPPPPRTLLEALEQRMERYRVASGQAKDKGDDRKARMHDRIVKQYQDAIRAHKSGRSVDVAELPVPPGFPPIQGLEAATPTQQSLVGVLETAMRLANQDEDVEETKKPSTHSLPSPQPKPQTPRAPGPGTGPPGKVAVKGSTKAQQQLAFLEGRKKQLLQAALRAKQKNDLEGAKLFLRQAKGLEPMLEASINGLPVDITKVPPAPVNKEDFTLAQRPGAAISLEEASHYAELTKLMRQQHEMCLKYSNQFTHLGNVVETSKFEKMAEDCKKSMEILKQAHSRGFPLPKFHYEQRTFSVVKIFPELSSSDMVLFIVKGINLPTPQGVSPSDLDAFVRFDFPYPNAEEAQKDKTNVIKNTASPEFKEQFKLFIQRGHRGFKRAIQTKGIKFEVVHKGGLFKPDRTLGTAQLKLEALESACEIREILEILDGRRPTGGRLEVMVRLREPLTSQQLDTVTERWLVIDPLPLVAAPKAKAPPIPAPGRDHGGKPANSLRSLSVMAFDRERLERKIVAYEQARRAVPRDLAQKYQDLVQHSQWQRAQLEQGGPGIRREYHAQLEGYLQYYTEAARRLGSDGNRDAAKEALYKRNLVERELQQLRR
ncbi:coiled-coil and C2 domain-containing protein 1A isoform X2 [Dromiciops gliroides]|uniref:coiled-coil and C2 domain-containing protein 1A isoform X2 n=1 Tax=Dromiciops gliroides TaxID=33562 RepID=UPI001CC392B8|nr:coiled-coil and C2 domain-containing protein 1A isoform X2 [Dromiciops gliroides]